MNRALLIIGIMLVACSCLLGIGLIALLVAGGSSVAVPAIGIGAPAKPKAAAIVSCEEYVPVTVAPTPAGTAGPNATATPEPQEAPLTQSEAIDALVFDYCRWEAAQALVPVPRGWSVRVQGRVGAATTSPGDLGVVRMDGTGPLEEITVALWARNQPGGQSPSVVYPNPWVTLSALYETDVLSTQETSLAGRRASEARGIVSRRPVVVASYYDGGKAWAFGASSDERSQDSALPVLERIAAALRPDAQPQPSSTPLPPLPK